VNLIFFLQLIIVVALGGFAGEYYRMMRFEELSNRMFMANVLAGGFLSFLIGYAIYTLYNNEKLAIILSGLISYQDVDNIQQITKNLIKTILKGGDGSDNEKK